MKNGWQVKKLVDVATLQRGFDLPTQNRVSGDIPLVTSSGVSDTHNRSAVRGPGVATGRSGSIGNVFFIENDFWPLNTVLYVKDFHGNDPRFVFHLLKQFDLKRFASGSGVPTLNRNFVHDELVSVPPLPEQRRIVALLDEAFVDIATAKANCEKNLQNAHALFESHLQSVFTQRGKGWVDRQLASLCREITVGHVGPMKSQYKESGIPFLRSQNIRPFGISMENAMFIDGTFHRALKKSQLRPGDLAIVRTGYPGTAAVIPPELPDSNCSDLVIVRPSKEVSPHFLAAFFNSAFGKQLVLGKIVGAAQKHFNITAAKEVMLHVPPLSEQLAIIAKSDELREETQRLAALYEQKLAALEALKKSLLHQAFTGELTKGIARSVVSQFPIQIPHVSTTDLHAGILAIAYQAHSDKNKLPNFAHVKAEKIAHMVESFVGIDLGRMPVKDAAGPNDFPHLTRVEHRARKAGFFDFQQSMNGAYRVTTLRRFDKLLADTRERLGSRYANVESVIELMVPMNTQQAEIAATVFAAWNNLLLENLNPTDDQIVTEARENWHPAKLNIPREKFVSAIQWLRAKNIVPKGQGRKVLAKSRK